MTLVLLYACEVNASLCILAKNGIFAIRGFLDFTHKFVCVHICAVTITRWSVMHKFYIDFQLSFSLSVYLKVSFYFRNKLTNINIYN